MEPWNEWEDMSKICFIVAVITVVFYIVMYLINKKDGK